MKKGIVVFLLSCIALVSYGQDTPYVKPVTFTSMAANYWFKQQMKIDSLLQARKAIFRDSVGFQGVTTVPNALQADSNRKAANTGWVKQWIAENVSPGIPGQPTAAWSYNGNIGDTASYDGFLGMLDNYPLKVITNGVTRLIVPENGINRSAGAANKVLVIDTVTKKVYYTDMASGGGSGTIYVVNQHGLIIDSLTAGVYKLAVDSSLFATQYDLEGYIPLTGTVAGKQVTGDIELGYTGDASGLLYRNGDELHYTGFSDDGLPAFSFFDGLGNYSTMSLSDANIKIAANSGFSAFTGILGNRYFPNKNYLTYTQKHDIDLYADSLRDEIAGKQNLVTLTTTGTSGAATFNQSTGALNIPNYATGGGGSSGLDDVMAFDSVTTHQLISNQKLKTSDSSVVANSYTTNGFVAGDSIAIATDNILVYGNSIELGLGVTSSYLSLEAIASRLNTTIVNRGISGTWLQQTASNDSSFTNRLYTVPNYNSSIRYILIGNYTVNEANTGKDVALYQAALAAALDTLIINRSYPAKRIVLLTGSPIYTTGAGKTIDTLRPFVNATIAVAKEKGVILIDNFNYMLNNGGRSLLQADSVHPNQAGHIAMADALEYGLGGIKANGGLTVKRSAQISGYLGVNGLDLSDAYTASNSKLARFKVTEGSNYLSFNGGSANNSIVNLSMGTSGQYLRLQASGTSNFLIAGGAASLNLWTNSTQRYSMSSSGAHTIAATQWDLTNTGATNLTLSSDFTATSSASAGAQYRFLGNSTSTLFRARFGNSSTEQLYIGQNSASSEMIGGATQDWNIYGFSADSSQKLMIGAGGNSLPSITVHSSGHGVNIGTDVTNVANALLNVQFSASQNPKASMPFPRMTAAQLATIGSPSVGMHVYQTDGTEGVYVYKSSGWTFAY